MYAVGHVALSREGQFLAAVLGAGEGAALSHLAAAELWEVRKYRAPLIDVVAPKRRQRTTGVRLHRARALHPRDVTTYKGIPVTTIARTLVDLTDVLNAYDLANVIHEAEFKHRFSEQATRDAMHRANGRHNLQAARDGAGAQRRGQRRTQEPQRGRLSLNAQEPARTARQREAQRRGTRLPLAGPQARRRDRRPGHDRPRTQREDERKEAAWREAGYEVLRVTDLRAGLTRLRAALEPRPPAESP